MRSDSTFRDDRARSRIRARAGIKFKPLSGLEFNIRGRTGSNDSQQSPHITIFDLDGNDLGDADFNLDKWYAKASSSGASLWVGRNGIPFWKQNELFWDDDVTVVGFGAQISRKLSDEHKLTFNGGYFGLPLGVQDLSGSAAVAQIVSSHSINGIEFNIAGGGIAIRADSDDEDSGSLLNGNGLRDYEILTASIMAKIPSSFGPVTLGFDLFHNVTDYGQSGSDAFAIQNDGEDTGIVLSAALGSLKERGDWLIGYYYARIETLAVNASFAQDDWLRFGSGTQTASSNFSGYEIRLGYAFHEKINLLGRFYDVESLTSPEDGRRARLDLNVKY